MTATLEQLLTVEEFWQQYQNRPLELVDGRIQEKMPPGGEHGVIAVNLATLLRIWAKQAGGRVGTESGFLLRRNPDTLRGPDLYYVSALRMPATGVPLAFWQQAPDLAVEIVSPSETANEVQDKVWDYLSAGTALVWLVYPHSKRVVAHTPDDIARTFKKTDTLEQNDVLPGFRCVVAEIFE